MHRRTVPVKRSSNKFGAALALHYLAPQLTNSNTVVKIVADNAIPFLKGVLEPYARVEYLPGKTIATADVRDADALIVRTRTRCDAALLEGSSVKLIATATIGFDHIDTEYCRDTASK